MVTATAKKKTSATKKVTTSSSKPSISRSKYSSADLEKIRERAYYIWMRNGMPQGTDTQDWSLAERELKAEKLIK